MARKLYVKQAVGVLAVATFLFVAPAIAQTSQSQSSQTQSDQAQRYNDRDVTRGELASFDQFLDGHREIAEQVRKNPSLVNNQQFVQNHPALQTYLQQHPNVREEIGENPNAFMRQENRYDRREDARADRDADMTRLEPDRDANRQNASDDRDLTNGRRDADNRQTSARTTTSASARTSSGSSAGTSAAANTDVNQRDPDNDANRQDADNRRNDQPTRGELARFDQFMDSHREISEQVKKDPDLLRSQQYVQQHPALQSFLQQNEGVRRQVELHPNAFMQREDRYDAREDARNGDAGRRDRDRQELANFDRFLDGHREAAQQLRRDPSLVNNQQFVQSHPALQSYLQDHPAVRQQLTQDPNAFMQRENRYDAREDARNGDFDRRDRDMDDRRDDRQQGRNGVSDRPELASFDRFLDSHREEAEQLRRDPSLIDNRQFVQSHPALQAYLQQNPNVRQAINQDPNAFMRQENQFDRREDMNRGHSMEAANFREFLGSHSDISRDLARDPSKANNANYQKSHPEFGSYLSAHPEVKSALNSNPENFMKTVQQPVAPTTGTTGTATKPSATTPETKPPTKP